MAFSITKDYPSIIVFIGGCLLGAAAAYSILPARVVPGPPEERIIEKQVPVVQEVIRHTTNTEVRYLPKDSVIERKADGSTVERKEKTDVDLQLAPPVVAVRVNGQLYESHLLQGETQKFELGKVSLQQNSQIAVDLQIKPHIVFVNLKLSHALIRK